MLVDLVSETRALLHGAPGTGTEDDAAVLSSRRRFTEAPILARPVNLGGVKMIPAAALGSGRPSPPFRRRTNSITSPIKPESRNEIEHRKQKHLFHPESWDFLFLFL
jgi:hypothetical protein